MIFRTINIHSKLLLVFANLTMLSDKIQTRSIILKLFPKNLYQFIILKEQ